ncbi:hypothetical protein BV25DRAFT_1918431 [Artomyces pyxidatus]|uniref:Uncharacterized protein n=1 Tax=Artomyces pyxidatus TaxID=48021 RepID=A0ACB8SU13_9AGAM|nr:hypothetical protein BV25DRAFT_1918431 [Artomyces pyxidatus]
MPAASVSKHGSPTSCTVHAEAPSWQVAQLSLSDPYHGQETVAKLCARFVSHLFAYSNVHSQPVAPATPSTRIPRLDHFIAYALHRTRLHTCVAFAALYFLQRLKARFPAAKGTSGRRLFISAYMVASKVICDDTYSNRSWCIVSQGIFTLREINQMECEMCSYLEWQLTLDPIALRSFELMVRHDFAGTGPYPLIARPLPWRSACSLMDRMPAPHTLTTVYPSPRPSTPSDSLSISTAPMPSTSAFLPMPPELAYADVKAVAYAKPTTIVTSGEGLTAGGGSSLPYPKSAELSTPIAAAALTAAHLPKFKVDGDRFAFAVWTTW